MKLLILLSSLLTIPAFACVDISGKYLIANTFVIQYTQKACESLTETWCSQDGKDCDAKDSYTWPLNGTMVQDGGNPSNWASIIPEGQTLHRTQAWDSGTTSDGHQCWWTEQWYAKDAQANLKVTYKLECLNGKGEYETKMKEEIWPLVR